jgi:hypothetical protein
LEDDVIHVTLFRKNEDDINIELMFALEPNDDDDDDETSIDIETLNIINVSPNNLDINIDDQFEFEPDYRPRNTFGHYINKYNMWELSLPLGASVGKLEIYGRMNFYKYLGAYPDTPYSTTEEINFSNTRSYPQVDYGTQIEFIGYYQIKTKGSFKSVSGS